MLHNVGSVDRVVRIVGGVVLVAASLLGLIGPWGYVGIVPILTGSFRFCPAYLPFGLSTCALKPPASGR